MNLQKKLKKTATLLFSLSLRYALVLAAVGIVVVLSLKLPELHDLMLRRYVGDRTYMIKDGLDSGGGTGFAVQAPSGTSYILTNDHVCGVSSDKTTVLVVDEHGNYLRRHIIAHDEFSDLCLIEGWPGVKGLGVASSMPARGEHVTVIGHPKLLPLHLARGEMVSTRNLSIMLGVIAVIDPDTHKEIQIDPSEGGMLAKDCRMKKNSQEYVDFNLLFFTIKVKVCMENIRGAYETSVIGFPGNSGSPAVNMWGSVTGALFAGDSNSNWSYLVSLADIKSFLKNY